MVTKKQEQYMKRNGYIKNNAKGHNRRNNAPEDSSDDDETTLAQLPR